MLWLWCLLGHAALVLGEQPAEAPNTITTLQREQAGTLSWLKQVKVFIYDLSEAGFQSSPDLFRPNGPFCNGGCPAQFKAPIWGADLCNNGYGQPVSENQTYASLGPLWTNNDDVATTFFMYSRLYNSKYRTYNPEEANLFLVPLYLSLFCRSKYANFQKQCGLQFTDQMTKKFWTWLYKQPMFQRRRGRDHFMVLSKTWGRAYRCDPLSTWVQTKYLRNPQPGWADFKWWGADNMQKLAHSNSYAPDSGWKRNAHPFPYPSAVHYVGRGGNASWSADVGVSRSGVWDIESMFARKRWYLASYVGTLWRGLTSPSGTSVYWKLKILTGEVCYNAPDCLANILDAPPQQPGTPRQPWTSYLPHRVKFGAFERDSGQVDRWLVDRGIAARFPQLTYLHSTFCLTPPGDGPTRKGLFDAILFGCIPVVFHKETLKYPWYFPKEHLRAFAVILNADDVVEGKTDMLAALRRISSAEIAEKRAALQHIAFSMQFSITDSTEEELERRGPDAVEVAIAGMLRHASKSSKG